MIEKKDNTIYKSSKQPSSLYLIFSIELWERFGFYGLQGILTIYLTKHLNMSETQSFELFSSFTALVYGFVSLGGWLGDKILGSKRVIIFGILVLTIGYLFLALSKNNINLLYLGLSTVSVGNGLFKANPSALLSSCYQENDERLDSAFTIYYMAINIGSFLSMFIVPLIVKHFGWNIAFSMSVVGLLITMLNFILCKNLVKDFGSKPDFKKIDIKVYVYVVIGTIFMIAFSNWLLKNFLVTKVTLILIYLFITAFFTKEMICLKGNNKKKMIVAFILMNEAMIFFVLYGQMPTSLNFFAEHNVERKIFGISLEPAQYQALNPMWIMLISPLLSIFYRKFGSKFSIPYKFSIGMVFCSVSFLLLSLSSRFSSENGIVSPYWLIMSYGLQSVGELMISGLGLSMIAKLIPRNLIGFVMGSWFLTSSIAAFLSGHLASMTTFHEEKLFNQLDSLYIYSSVFMKIGIVTAIISVIMLIISPVLNKIANS
ncbi:peptide ABC transporter permease [Candidatus Riesia sp. GBBU]|nr:peptide ABC transporter permease [Candidatus Riesia sp. GBBU]ARC55082.1 peptide ABC transporter permease [Candidatus Riesia sp. GBBU]